MCIFRQWLFTPDGRLRAPWRLLVVGVAFVVVNVAVTLAVLAAGLPVDPTRTEGPGLAAALGVLVLDGLVAALLVLAAARVVDRRVLPDVGWRLDGRTGSDLAAGLAIGLGLVGAAYAAGVALGVYDPAVDPAAPPGYPFAVWLAVLTAAMVVVAVYEELLLRGYVLTNLAEGLTAFLGRRASVAAALVVSSLGFGLLHGANPAASPRSLATVTLAGLLLGLAYVYTGSLSFPVGLHVTWNLSGVLLGLPVSGLEIPIRLVRTEVTGDPAIHGGGFGIEGGLLGLGATVLGCLAVVGYARLTGRTFRTEIATPALRS